MGLIIVFVMPLPALECHMYGDHRLPLYRSLRARTAGRRRRRLLLGFQYANTLIPTESDVMLLLFKPDNSKVQTALGRA